MSKTEWFDGWVHDIIPGEDFNTERVVTTVAVEETEDAVEPYESPNRYIVTNNAAAVYPAGRIPFQDEQAAWARISVCLHSLCTIIGGVRKAYQLNTYGDDKKPNPPTFQFKYEEGAGMPAGSRL